MPRNVRTYKKLIQPNQEQLIDAVNELIESVNTSSAAAEKENYKGKPGDIRVNKVKNNKYDFYIRGEDGWHRDTNSSFAPVNDAQTQDEVNAIMLSNGTIDNQYLGSSRIVFNLDKETGPSGIANPKVEIKGNGDLVATGVLKLNSGSTVTIEVPLKLNSVSNAGVDTNKFLVLDASNTVKFRTGDEIITDLNMELTDLSDVSIDSNNDYYFTDADGDVIQITYNDHLAPTEQTRIQVRNDEGSTIPAGTPLYSKGEIGGSERILVGVCDANDSAKMPCIGIADAEMNTTTTQDNYAVVSGVYNTNISGFTGLSEGDILYVSNTGGLTHSKPTNDDDLIQNVGIVLKTNGSICQGMLVSAIGRTNDVPNVISCNEITSGAVVWERFPFIVSSGTAGRYYYRDVDDGANSFALWDDYDTDPTGFSYLDVPGQYVVPEDCTLKAMNAVVTNFTSTTSVTLSIYHGTPNLDTTSDTTLALAGTATTVTISTARYAYSASATYDVDLTAGDIIVPTVSHANAGATQTMRGNITLKFVTR